MLSLTLDSISRLVRSLRSVLRRKAWVPIVVLQLTMTTEVFATSKLTVGECYLDSGRDVLGVDDPNPRLSWRIEASVRGQQQRAYQVQVASSLELLVQNRADRWDSGKVVSNQSIQIKYAGATLRSRDVCFWRVRVWDDSDTASDFSSPARWEMGLLQADDWQGEWLGYTGGWPGRALYFRHVFEVTKPVRSARVYVAGLGYHELRINGAKIGDHVLDPGWTDFSQRVLYVTHDVGSHVKPGRNAIAVCVGHGWYGTPKLLLQLELTYEDGSREVIPTRGGHTQAPDVWFVASGPITADSVYDGETYDARLEKIAWDQPTDKLPWGNGGREEGWVTATPTPPPGGRLVAQMLEPIRGVETRRPVKVSEPKPGSYVFDTGQNLAGWAAIQVKGPQGTVVTLKFAETLRPDGTVNQDNLRRAAARDVYILRGEGVESWEPRFTYHGFRYVQVEGWPGVPTADQLQIRVVRSAVQPVGTFACSNDLLNRIHQMVARTEASNLHGLPTDCPQRDERMGWLNDMTVRIEPALYNFRLGRLYAKWGDDIQDTQSADGAITDTAPFQWGKRPADPVSISYLLTGWMPYLHYGDLEALRAHYASYRQWVDYLVSRSENGILNYSSWGDWAPPQNEAVAGSEGAGAISAKTPGDLISTGFLYYHARLLAQIAQVLGDSAESRRRNEFAAKVRSAFNAKYWDESTGGYGSNNQACNAFALFLEVVDPPRVRRVVDNLVQAVERNQGHLSTGNICSKYLLEMLTEHGHADVAFRIATQTTYPSWGFMLANDATTLWERWEYLTGGAMNSHNHAMLGSVGSWFYKYVAGIRADPTHPGFAHFTLRPYVIDGLDWAEASYEILQGTIRSAWRKEKGMLTFKISVPVNCLARVHLPARATERVLEHGAGLGQVDGVKLVSSGGPEAVLDVGSGDYEFTVQPR